MKKSLFLATTGIAGVLLFAPQSNAKAELNVHISMGNRSPVLVVSNYPNFIYLDMITAFTFRMAGTTISSVSATSISSSATATGTAPPTTAARGGW